MPKDNNKGQEKQTAYWGRTFNHLVLEAHAKGIGLARLGSYLKGHDRYNSEKDVFDMFIAWIPEIEKKPTDCHGICRPILQSRFWDGFEH